MARFDAPSRNARLERLLFGGGWRASEVEGIAVPELLEAWALVDFNLEPFDCNAFHVIFVLVINSFSALKVKL